MLVVCLTRLEFLDKNIYYAYLTPRAALNFGENHLNLVHLQSHPPKTTTTTKKKIKLPRNTHLSCIYIKKHIKKNKLKKNKEKKMNTPDLFNKIVYREKTEKFDLYILLVFTGISVIKSIYNNILNSMKPTTK